MPEQDQKKAKVNTGNKTRTLENLIPGCLYLFDTLNKAKYLVYLVQTEAKAYLLMLLLSKTRYLVLNYAYKINERKEKRWSKDTKETSESRPG